MEPEVIAGLVSEALPTEACLLTHLQSPCDLAKERSKALVVSPGRAQTAEVLSRTAAFEHVEAWYMDLYAAAVAGQAFDEGGPQVVCSADLPEASYDLVAIPTLKKSEAELTRELLQQAHQRLSVGGVLVTSVENPKDQWLHEQMQTLFNKVTSVRDPKGCVYWGRKTEELKKVKDFTGEFAFRDEEERLIHMTTRPGVFSHRRLDSGARQLMLFAEVGEEDRVLDMGCGAGAVAIATSFLTKGRVLGVDSNARAIECLKQNAKKNDCANVEGLLNADGQLGVDDSVDLALANPPYYGDHRISQHFVDSCIQSLRVGGALLVVTKQPRWFEGYMHERLEDLAIFETARYHLVCGRKV